MPNPSGKATKRPARNSAKAPGSRWSPVRRNSSLPPGVTISQSGVGKGRKVAAGGSENPINIGSLLMAPTVPSPNHGHTRTAPAQRWPQVAAHTSSILAVNAFQQAIEKRQENAASTSSDTPGVGASGAPLTLNAPTQVSGSSLALKPQSRPIPALSPTQPSALRPGIPSRRAPLRTPGSATTAPAPPTITVSPSSSNTHLSLSIPFPLEPILESPARRSIAFTEDGSPSHSSRPSSVASTSLHRSSLLSPPSTLSRAERGSDGEWSGIQSGAESSDDGYARTEESTGGHEETDEGEMREGWKVPPLIDSSIAGLGPGAFTDDAEDLPTSTPIRDPTRSHEEGTKKKSQQEEKRGGDNGEVKEMETVEDPRYVSIIPPGHAAIVAAPTISTVGSPGTATETSFFAERDMTSTVEPELSSSLSRQSSRSSLRRQVRFTTSNDCAIDLLNGPVRSSDSHEKEATLSSELRLESGRESTLASLTQTPVQQAIPLIHTAPLSSTPSTSGQVMVMSVPLDESTSAQPPTLQTLVQVPAAATSVSRVVQALESIQVHATALVPPALIPTKEPVPIPVFEPQPSTSHDVPPPRPNGSDAISQLDTLSLHGPEYSLLLRLLAHLQHQQQWRSQSQQYAMPQIPIPFPQYPPHGQDLYAFMNPISNSHPNPHYQPPFPPPQYIHPYYQQVSYQQPPYQQYFSPWLVPPPFPQPQLYPAYLQPETQQYNAGIIPQPPPLTAYHGVPEALIPAPDTSIPMSSVVNPVPETVSVASLMPGPGRRTSRKGKGPALHRAPAQAPDAHARKRWKGHDDDYDSGANSDIGQRHPMGPRTRTRKASPIKQRTPPRHVSYGTSSDESLDGEPLLYHPLKGVSSGSPSSSIESTSTSPHNFDPNIDTKPVKQRTYGAISHPNAPYSSGKHVPWTSPGSPNAKLLHHNWKEYRLPGSTRYFYNQPARVVTDIDLSHSRVFNYVQAFLVGILHSNPVPDGWELWLRGGSTRTPRSSGRKSMKVAYVVYWVNHPKRTVGRQSPYDKAKGRHIWAMEDELNSEYQYWAFIDSHPAHTSLPADFRKHAEDALNWAYSDRMLSEYRTVPPAFTPDECEALMDLLGDAFASEDSNDDSTQSVIQNRIVSRILLHMARWRQTHFCSRRPLLRNAGTRLLSSGIVVLHPRPYSRTVFHFIISCVCLGIPSMFSERSVDVKRGFRPTAPVIIMRAVTCLVAAIILSASITILSFPDLDSITKTAGFVAVILASLSMTSPLLSILRPKSGSVESTPSASSTSSNEAVERAEGLVDVSLQDQKVIYSLPLVFLAYSMIAFITAIVLYSSKVKGFSGQ